MKKRYIALTAMVFLIGGCRFGDELLAYSSGSPVRLISASGSLDSFDAKKEPLQELLHASLHSDKLRLVVRTYFYTSGSLSRPYLTVDEQHRGVLHVSTKSRFSLFTTKCEFLRQFEVEISPAQLKGLRTLQIFNHETERQVTDIQLSNPEYMRKLFYDSQINLAFQDISGVGAGC
ncbi:hypothetical protein INH39_24365 [Massilia violaceinigra]|uniref:Lipoprotein n=1 Tax=Massilia violaceinigra TaxID=2045208 RepID=A0ABY4A4R7_9BURK|nr:hypothetical protein [Massilia violaceinigra]UOD28556.1 hypothetical protein INH39_24365 [Massilia violaceinigra]